MKNPPRSASASYSDEFFDHTGLQSTKKDKKQLRKA
jgi:hypothetical protein